MKPLFQLLLLLIASVAWAAPGLPYFAKIQMQTAGCNPTSVAGLWAWYNPLSTIATNYTGTPDCVNTNDKVRYWSDVSGNNRPLTNGWVAQPYYRPTEGPTGGKAIYWDGTSASQLGAAPVTHAVPPFYVFTVLKIPDFAAVRYVEVWQTAANTDGLLTTTPPDFEFDYVAGSYPVGVSTNWQVVTVSVTTSNTATFALIRTNGVNYFASYNVMANAGFDHFCLGSNPGGNSAFKGWMAESLVYVGSVLNPSNIVCVETYLKSKYGL